MCTGRIRSAAASAGGNAGPVKMERCTQEELWPW